ncbi:hypothetical protein [Novosphingobium sp.]|uniref:hypothetical protein n=1 Tax=Novosphingobium sp. TaxID=1874826 RepID=UPI0035B20F16
MRAPILAVLFAAALLPQSAQAETCQLTPKQVATQFMTRFYEQKDVRGAFETWVDPGYIQHNRWRRPGAMRPSAFSNRSSPAIPASIMKSSG